MVTLIPRVIHVAWKSKNLFDLDSIFLDNCINNVLNLAQDWRCVLYDDVDIDKYLAENLEHSDYNLLKNSHIIEKCDVWRLLKLYNEGGLYVDIDRLCNTSLNSIIEPTTKVVLPTCKNLDFSQDFMLSATKNPIFLKTLELNLKRRFEGCKNLYFLGAQTYLHGIMLALLGEIIPQTEENIIEIRNIIKNVEFIQTYVENPPYDTILFRQAARPFDHEMEKRKFYASQNVRHWTNEW